MFQERVPFEQNRLYLHKMVVVGQHFLYLRKMVTINWAKLIVLWQNFPYLVKVSLLTLEAF